jgi:hypothetical protein
MDEIELPGYRQCEQDSDGSWHFGECIDSSSYTQLVFAFDAAPVRFSSAEGAFGIAPDVSVATDWIEPTAAWLAYDRNGNGRIDDGGELFGSATELPGGVFATNGFEALRALDDDGDGVITSHDRAFSSLVLWTDRDLDRSSAPSELVSLEGAGVRSISLAYDAKPRCDARGNCEIETAAFTFEGASGAAEGRVVDVHLRAR